MDEARCQDLFFEFQHPTDYPIALATVTYRSVGPGLTTAAYVCLICVPQRLATACAPSARMVATGSRAPHGLRLQRSVHHPVRDTLAWLLTPDGGAG